MEPKYVYESHLGGFYTSYEELDYELLYCEQCGDCDFLLGMAANRKEAKDLLWDDDEYDEEDYDDSYIKRFIEEEWKE